MAFLSGIQARVRWRRWLLCLWLFPCFSNAQVLSEPGPTTKPAAVSPSSFLSHFSGIDLIDQSGQVFQASSLANNVVLFSFIFTDCTSACPLQTRVLSNVLKDLPDDVRARVRFVSVSIDPATDTPEKLQRFAAQMEADQQGWSFLTGDSRQIAELTQRLHLIDEPASGQQALPQIHRTSLWLVDQQGRMLQRYRGDPPDQDRLIRELSQLSRMGAAGSSAF